MYRDGRCPICGHPLDECTSMEGQGPDFAAEYTACRVTLAILEKQRAIFDPNKPDPNADAYLWAARKRR